MKLRAWPAAAAAVVLSACGPGAGAPEAAPAVAPPPAFPAAAPAADLAGRYEQEGPRTGVMTVAPAGGEWRLSLRGGSDPSDGAAVAADCELEVQGPLRDGRIIAPVVPFEGETVTVTARQLAANPATVTAEVTPGGLRVSTDYAGCGLGSDLSGLYRRAGSAAAQEAAMTQPAAALRPGDDLAAVRRAFPDARLRVVEAYPFAGFAVLNPDGTERMRLRFDGENADFADGSNTFSRIGEEITYAALRPDLRVEAVEPPGDGAPEGESGAPPA